jgi:hypothetical protein
MKLLPILFLSVILSSATPFVQQIAPATFVPREPTMSIYEVAEILTGAPAEILRGIEFAESSNWRNLDHPDPFDSGGFGLHERPSYHAERAGKWGEYDANNPADAARIAGHIYVENLSRLGSVELALCAYRQGVGGVRVNGPELWYAERVLG